MRSNKLYLKYFIFKYNIKKIVDIILQIKKKIKKTKIKKILLFKNFKNVNLKIIKLFQKKKYILSSIDIKQNSLIIEEEEKEEIGKVRFYVFAGRQKNLELLHQYIDLALKNIIIDEYHIFDFSRNINDHFFLYQEYNRFKNIYIDRIFLHNFNENEEKLKQKIINEKQDWNPFYKEISTNTNANDVIIKCDDDILFIDIYSLKNAINDRFNDKTSFLIHSNCINNGICAFYQKECFDKIKDILNVCPVGGLLGILFEKPEIAYAMHSNFIDDLLDNICNLNKYIIKDQFINSRISINFILINGSDTKYLKNVGINDEYEVSSFYPEKLLRPNKIKGDLITAHFSYNSQEKIIMAKDIIINKYRKFVGIFLNFDNNSIINKYNGLIINNLICNKENEYYIVRNWNNEKSFYIKNDNTKEYIYIDFEKDEIEMSTSNKTLFTLNKLNDKFKIHEIKLGVFYLTPYNCRGKFRNEKLLYQCLKDESMREIILEEIENRNIDSYFIKFKKNNLYLSINNKNDKNIFEISKEKDDCAKWVFEKTNHEKFIKVVRFIKNNKFYYKNIQNNEIYTNYYLGWGYENILYEK